MESKERNDLNAGDEQHAGNATRDSASDNGVLENVNKDATGHDLREEENDRARHHQAHGNRHYESLRNHSSADDQPMTDTGA